MRSISATDAKQSLGALLDVAQREPVVIRRHHRDIAVVLSPQEYERLRSFHLEEFERFCARIADQAAARGMTPAVLETLLLDEDPGTAGR